MLAAVEQPRIWTPPRRRIERDSGGDWRRWRDADPEALRCMGPFPAHPSGFAPEAMGGGVAAVIAAAVLDLDPANLGHSGGSCTTWTNSGTAGSTLSIPAATAAPGYSATGGANGGPTATFASASLQYFQGGTYVWSQPSTVIVRCNLSNALVAQTLCDDAVTGSRLRVVNTSSGHPSILAATQLTGTDAVTASTWLYFVGQFNGASSKVGLSALTTTGNAGVLSGTGFTLGTFQGHSSQFVNGSIDRVLAWTGATYGTMSSTILANVLAWMSTR